jgi:hypothetical protein
MLNDRHATSRLVQSLMSSEGDARKNAPLFAEISICSGTTPSTIPSPGWINVPLHEFPFIVENENEITRFTPDPSNTAARVAIGFPFSRQSSAEVRNDSPIITAEIFLSGCRTDFAPKRTNLPRSNRASQFAAPPIAHRTKALWQSKPSKIGNGIVSRTFALTNSSNLASLNDARNIGACIRRKCSCQPAT